jgi:SAM-dependent methyltransferase
VADVIPDGDLQRFYSDYWGTFRPAPGTRSGARRFRESAEAGASHDIRLQRLEALLGGLGDRRIFEVGCGLGAFLAAAKVRGAEVIGQEVSRVAGEFAREKMGVPVLQDPLERSVMEVGSPDVVVMIDVLEHLSRPREALASIWRTLPPDGLLLLWTPNGGAAGTSLETARTWVGFRVDLDHLQYFSAGAIARLCEGGAWGIEHLETVGFPDLGGVRGESASRGGRLRRAAEEFGSRMPGARPLARAARAVGRELRVRGSRDARRGTYHLFTILRKAQAETGSGGAEE